MGQPESHISALNRYECFIASQTKALAFAFARGQDDPACPATYGNQQRHYSGPAEPGTGPEEARRDARGRGSGGRRGEAFCWTGRWCCQWRTRRERLPEWDCLERRQYGQRQCGECGRETEKGRLPFQVSGCQGSGDPDRRLGQWTPHPVGYTTGFPQQGRIRARLWVSAGRRREQRRHGWMGLICPTSLKGLRTTQRP